MRTVELSELEAGKLRTVIKDWIAGLNAAKINVRLISACDREIKILKGVEKKLRKQR